MSGFLLRQAGMEDCPALGRILVAATQDAFRGLVPDHCLDWLTPEESATNWARYLQSKKRPAGEDFLFVAEAGSGGIIGLALLCRLTEDDYDDLPGLEAFTHELRTMQVYPALQRKGIGRRLVSCVADQLWKEGASHLLVRVLAENPNRGFYKHLGAVQLGSQPYDWEGYQTEAILYGWNDVSQLRSMG